MPLMWEFGRKIISPKGGWDGGRVEGLNFTVYIDYWSGEATGD